MKIEDIKKLAESDLETFIKLVAPHQLLGAIHSEWCSWTTSERAGDHQLTLLPRDHQKSRMIAYKVAWYITKRPDIRIFYLSSTSNLAEKQVKAVKDILTSPIYKRYWPEMVNEEEGKRELWNASEFSVDHPLRKTEGIRDPTVFTGGLNTSKTGMHCDIAVLDDVIVADNAYTKDGRDKVRAQYSLISSIEAADAEEWVVGTRYFPSDLYSDMLEMEHEIYDDKGEVVDHKPVYTVFERKVEDVGDGSGQFLWPRQQRADGKWFGFDAQILSKKRAKYLDKTQFRAQYYNDPNDRGELRISNFQYYEPRLLTNNQGTWFYNNRKLNVFASVDFAYSTSKKADYTAIVVVGVDRENMVYVLQIDRFKTERIPDYFEHIFALHSKWGFRKLGAEITAAQKAIVRELKDGYIRPNGLFLSIDEIAPTRHQGSKEERMAAILEPRYANMAIWHYKGGECQTLEEELISNRPAHDDCMDALASVLSIAVAPTGMLSRDQDRKSNVIFHPRFGGIAA